MSGSNRIYLGDAAGELYISTATGNNLWKYNLLKMDSFGDHLGHYIKGFGQDNHGEIYVLGTTILGPRGNSGKVFKLVGKKG